MKTLLRQLLDTSQTTEGTAKLEGVSNQGKKTNAEVERCYSGNFWGEKNFLLISKIEVYLL